MSDTARGSVDISAAQIDDEGRSWIEVMPTATEARNGRWYFTITAEDLDAAAAYIKANPDRIPIDYDHRGSDGDTRAAGWFTGNAEVRDGLLVAEVKWTPQAVQEIRDGAFRFISPEWSMTNTDKKSGLMTKFKEMLAATLTNRPFFKEMAAVTARELLESDDLDALKEKFGPGAPEALLALLAPGELVLTQEHIKALLATDEKPPAEGDTVNPEVLKLLGLPEDATDDQILEAVKSATEEPKETEVTDYLKALKLDPDAEPSKKFAAAMNSKDEELLELRGKVTDLTAQLAEGEKLNERIAELEKRDKARDNEVILTRAIEKGQILPAEREQFEKIFADNPRGLRELIATRPAGFMSRTKPIGSGASDPERFAADADVAEYVKAVKGPDPVDTESAKTHLAALVILKERGVKESDDNYADEYISAVEEAGRELAAY